MVANTIYVLLIALLPIIGLFVNFSSYVIFLRFKIRMLVSLLFGFLLGAFGMLIGYILLGQGITSELVALQLVIYILFSYCLFHFNNLAITARRIRIIREIYIRGNGISIPELLAIYNAKIMVDLRLGRLIDAGQILFFNDRLYINSKFLLGATMIIVALKRVFYNKTFSDIANFS